VPVPYAQMGDPQTLNLYAYVGNNPMIHIDADGHCWPQWLCNAVNQGVETVLNHVKPLPQPPPPRAAPKANAAALTSGVAITYSQSTGLTTILHADGNELPLGIGYAGHGAGLNNPDNQYVKGENAGPPPEGVYKFGPMQDYTIKTGPHKGHKLQNAMTLTPERGTFMGVPPRGALLAHGGNFKNFNSSLGCEVLPPDVRSTINQLHIRYEVVVP